MKKLILVVSLVMLASNLHADVKSAISNATKGIVKFSKEVAGGISEGLSEGRSSTEGADGAVVVTNEAEALKYIQIELISVSPTEDKKQTVVVIGFRNKHNKPVRVTSLKDKGVLLTLDRNGYSNALVKRYENMEITIPNEAGARHSFTFSGMAENVQKVRIWNTAYSVPKKAEK